MKKGTILTIIGVIGSAALAFLAGRKSKNVEKRIEERTGRKISNKEKWVSIGKSLIAPIIAVGGTLASVIIGDKLSYREQAMLKKTLGDLKTSYDKYDKSVENVFGVEGQRAVQTDRVLNTPKKDMSLGEEEEMFWIGYGFDDYFKTTRSKLDLAVGYLNRKLRIEHTATFADFLEYLGIDPNEKTSFVGWGRFELYGELEDGWLDLKEDTIDMSDGAVCTALTFYSNPTQTYEDRDKLYRDEEPDIDRECPFDYDKPTHHQNLFYKKKGS